MVIHIGNFIKGRIEKKITEDKKEYLKSLNVVSSDENAIWLVDYWCGKDIRGLIQMPFSRHWIMHIEASLRIKNKIHKYMENSGLSLEG